MADPGGARFEANGCSYGVVALIDPVAAATVEGRAAAAGRIATIFASTMAASGSHSLAVRYCS